MDKLRNIIIFFFTAIAGVAARAIFILYPARVYGDMAVYALMAKNISELKEFPIYMWLAHYAGALTCYIAAVFFKIMGVSAMSFNLTCVLISLAWIAVSMLLSKQLLSRTGYLSAAFLTLLPASGLFYYSLSAAGYGENLIFASLILLVAAKISDLREGVEGAGLYALLGALCGVGLWVSPVTAPLVPALLVLFFINDRKVFTSKRIVYFAGSFLLCYSPAIIYNIQYPQATLFRFFGRVLDIDRSALSSPDLVKLISERIIWRLSTVPGAIAGIPYKIYKLSGILNLTVFFAALVWIIREEGALFVKSRKISGPGFTVLYAGLYSIFYAIFIGGEQLRYIVPLILLLPLFAGKVLSGIRKVSRPAFVILLVMLLAENVFGIGHLFRSKEVHHYRELAQHLQKIDISKGYSDYWLAYPVIFESNESVIISPTLFDPVRDDRRPEYTKMVADSSDPAFIIDRTTYPDIEGVIEAQLKDKGMEYKKDEFMEFITYYSFSKKADPKKFSL